ncbi:MAG TPA: DNA mismatch repair endonuclease MutL, partial [Bryobacteraceae bacterium]|nr:DNA mismatch repair endonuclease MutL [Bryobacteraceae bacterium]
VITVRDLFYNLPARRKFLRTEQTELAHVAALVTHYSLAHPDKAFELRHGVSELLCVTPVRELRERIYQVFGADILEQLVDLGYHERTLTLASGAPDEDGSDPHDRVFSIRGFVSRPQVQKTGRNSIYLFVNGRIIRDRLLLHALSAAYHNLMPPGSYPIALVFLDCDCEEVDVNVHPSKTEVRFRHGSFVHDFIRDTIREVLTISRPASTISVPALGQPAAGLPYSEFSHAIDAGPWAATTATALDLDPPAASADLPVARVSPAGAVRFDFEAREPESGSRKVDLSGDLLTGRLPVPDTHQAAPLDVSDQAATMSSLRDLRLLGQLHDSFLVAASRDGLWLIDQHVAHERILFEKVLKAGATGRLERQQLLIPLVLQLSPSQQIQYARIAEELQASGFETEPFGHRTIAVKAAPAEVPVYEIERIVQEVLDLSERELRTVSVDDLRRGIAASIACRAAIKINMRLEAPKMEWLLRELEATEYPMACPHGRPVALRYSTRDILKAFHRI